jgi:hypothetical protein
VKVKVTRERRNPSIAFDAMRCEVPMSNCVYQGSALSMLSKIEVTLGTTTTIMTVTRTEPMTSMSAG